MVIVTGNNNWDDNRARGGITRSLMHILEYFKELGPNNQLKRDGNRRSDQLHEYSNFCQTFKALVPFGIGCLISKSIEKYNHNSRCG